jgi:hypothetical protein
MPSECGPARRSWWEQEPGTARAGSSGNEALVTPEHSAILKAFVDDTAAPLVEPSLP